MFVRNAELKISTSPKKSMEDFSFKMLRISGMQCNYCYGSEQGLVPRKTILDKNGWSMILLQAKAKRNARLSRYSLRLCTMPEGTPAPALHLYLCGKSGANELKVIKAASDLTRAHHPSLLQFLPPSPLSIHLLGHPF